MSDQISGHLSSLSRRDFVKLMLGAMIVITTGRITGAPTSMNITGYGSGRYGIGKYGVTSNRYSIFLPVIRK